MFFEDSGLDYAAIGTIFVSGAILFFKKLVIDIIYSNIKNNLVKKKKVINGQIKDEITIISQQLSKRKPPKSIREVEIIATLRKSKLKTKKRDLELREAELIILKELYEKERKIEIKLNKLDLKK